MRSGDARPLDVPGFEGGWGPRARTDGNDRERDTEKLTSHRPPEITRGNKQSICGTAAAMGMVIFRNANRPNFRTAVTARNVRDVSLIFSIPHGDLGSANFAFLRFGKISYFVHLIS